MVLYIIWYTAYQVHTFLALRTVTLLCRNRFQHTRLYTSWPWPNSWANRKHSLRAFDMWTNAATVVNYGFFCVGVYFVIVAFQCVMPERMCTWYTIYHIIFSLDHPVFLRQEYICIYVCDQCLISSLEWLWHLRQDISICDSHSILDHLVRGKLAPTFRGIFHDFSVRGKLHGRKNLSAKSCKNLFEMGPNNPRTAFWYWNRLIKNFVRGKFP